MFDLSTTMIKFHKEKVTLSGEEQGKMRDRRNTNRTRLKNGLTANGYPSTKGCYSQGSYRMRTMVQDDDNDYDIDDGVYFTDKSVDGKTSQELLDMVTCAVSGDKRFKTPPEQKSKCVRLCYSEGYHIDLPVYKITGEYDDTYNLATKDGWEQSDARAITNWFNSKFGKELTHGEDDPQQLRRIVRLTKKFARSRTADTDNWKEQMPSGICITKLVVDNHVKLDNRDDESLYETWKKVAYLPDCYPVNHPTEDKTLTDGYDKEVIFLKQKLRWAVNLLDTAQSQYYADEDEQMLYIADAWDAIFNTDFFTHDCFKHSESATEKWKNIGKAKRIDVSGSYNIKASSTSYYTKFESKQLLGKNYNLRFHANINHAKTNIETPFDVFWQVTNTGIHATQKRGEIFKSQTAGAGGLNLSKSEYKREEHTAYQGTHWIECFIVKDGACVARSGKFFVKIGSY